MYIEFKAFCEKRTYMSEKLEHCRVLVTGGAGFIGSNLIDELLHRGCEVVCLDNFETGKMENLAGALKHPGFRLITGDICNPESCAEAVKGVKYVFHQAAIGSVPRSIADPVHSTAVNITGFVTMLHAAKEAKVKRFIYAASSSTYGDNRELPAREDRIGTPLSPYAITKLVNEFFAENFAKLYGIETIGLRYFNVFGRRQDPDGAYAAVIPRFARSLLSHQVPVINGDGTISRDFTYIDNVVTANILAAEATGPAVRNAVCNIACGKSTSLNELFTAIRGALAEFDPAIAQIEAIHGAPRAGDIEHSLADITKARNLLGYIPSCDVVAGIGLAAEWYFHNLKK